MDTHVLTKILRIKWFKNVAEMDGVEAMVTEITTTEGIDSIG